MKAQGKNRLNCKNLSVIVCREHKEARDAYIACATQDTRQSRETRISPGPGLRQRNADARRDEAGQ
jgi:hypothetical protein